jgi:arylsulfatase A-like enzyme/thioredoxin-like negative regulator of GroEL
MKRQLAAPVALLALLLITPSCSRARASGPLNVLVITIDTMRADRLGCYGDAKAQTPEIDRLAREGVLFRNCYTSVPLTLPSHCSIFTGRLPIAHGVRNNGSYRLGGDEATLARLLKGRGYRTAALVAAYVLMGKYGLSSGFDVYDDALRSDELSGDFDSEIPADQEYRKYTRFMASKPPGNFFLWVHFYDPHKPYLPPAEYAKRFPGDPYRGEVAFVDTVIGRMRKDLRDRGLADDTLLVVTGDHGEAFGEHEEQGHGVFCYEEDVRVPLIFFGPKWLGRPHTVEARARLIDIMPTILEMLGMPVPPQVQGQSLLGLMRGRREDAPRDVYLETLYGKEENNWAPLTGMISGFYKYLSLPKAELYDLSHDGGERDNLFLRNNVLARKLDAQLAELVRRSGNRGRSERVQLSASDRKQLQALGYISSFSSAGAQAMDPKDGIRLANRMEELGQEMARGKIDQVQRELEEIVKDPKMRIPSFFQMLALIYRKKHDLRATQALLDNALTAFRGTPSENHFRLNLARLLLETNRLGPAQDLASQVLKEDGRNVMALVLQGEIAEKRADAPRAIEAYSLAEGLEPNNFALKKRLAEVFLRQRDIPAALDVYRRMLACSSSRRDPELLFQVATLTAQQGDLNEAESLLREAIAGGANGRYLFHLALIQSKRGDNEAALSSLREAVERHAQDLSPEQLRTARKLLGNE